jgi:endothelin-converting enzyme/putative endopeptidase
MYKSTTDQGKAINLFNSILDTVARDKQDIAPFYLAKIDKVKTLKTCY